MSGVRAGQYGRYGRDDSTNRERVLARLSPYCLAVDTLRGMMAANTSVLFYLILTETINAFKVTRQGGALAGDNDTAPLQLTITTHLLSMH